MLTVLRELFQPKINKMKYLSTLRVQNTVALFATSSQLESLALSHAESDGYGTTNNELGTPSPQPVYRDMGDYLGVFSDDPGDLLRSGVDLGVMPTADSGLGRGSQAAEALTSMETAMAQPSPEVDALVIQTAQDVLMRDFGEEWITYMGFQRTSARSGLKAIYGVRLFDQIAERFGLGANNVAIVDGIEISVEDVAFWMEQAVGTFRNWHTLERQRVGLLFRLDHMSEHQP
ncbi:hypothetical protein FRC08_011389 [Ceratobasidium sp. 394]|nr:hypothetical protein FRC08_011389 [Ceratobasidium sp. 394]